MTNEPRNLEISPSELHDRLSRGDKLILVDVREPWENATCSIAGARLIPMGEVPRSLESLDTGDDVICFCHHGMRSLDVTTWLRGQGIESAQSLAGGIERWSREIDPAVPRY